MQDNEFVQGTQELQEMSVVNFMAGMGYEPVYDYNIGLCAFAQPKYAHFGKARVSVNTAIKMHNNLAEETFQQIRRTGPVTFSDFISNVEGEDAIIKLFAGTTKIVKRAKLVFSRKNGIVCQDDKVKFMTKRDFAHYRKFIGA